MTRDHSPDQQQVNHNESDSIDYQTIVWLLNRIPDDEDTSSNRSKRRHRHRHEPEPKLHPTRDPEIEPEVDPSLESSMKDRFDPDEAYEDSPTPSYRD